MAVAAVPAPPFAAEKIDYQAIGLWDDGPCDPAKPPLKLGLMTVFESPVLSLKEQATALESVGQGIQRAWRRQWFLHPGHDVRRRRERRPGGRVRSEDRPSRRRRDGERHDHRGVGRRLEGDGRREDSARRAEPLERRLGRPECVSARRLQHRLRPGVAASPASGGHQEDRCHSCRSRGRIRARRHHEADLRRRRRDLPLRRAGSGRYDGLHPVPPRRGPSRNRRRRPRDR